MSVKDKWVRRFSVDETDKHKNGFTIYKITSVLFLRDSPDTVTVVSVWKRYSDVQRLHKSMRSLHAGLHLRGTFPKLAHRNYFKRFQQDVIEERSKSIKVLLEFIAEHRLLFTSADFVHFLQSGHSEPERGGVIDAIRSALQLPVEDAAPLEYQTDDELSTTQSRTYSVTGNPVSRDERDFISQIPIYEAADVEIRAPKKTSTDSLESLNSIESINSDFYEELSKISVDNKKSSVRRTVLPDLINFDAPSTSKFEDYHTMSKITTDSETTSLNSTAEEDRGSKMSAYSKRSALSLSNLDCKTRTEDSYVFEAGHLLNLATRCEDMGDYGRAFEYYKLGIEKMLIGVQTDPDPNRTALIKQKTNKYLSYAENIYKNHLYNDNQSLIPEKESNSSRDSVPIQLLRRPVSELGARRALGVLAPGLVLAVDRAHNHHAVKVIQKVPHNLTEFDEYFLQNTQETRVPVMPTNVPYMVPLQAYIETNNLIFLILSYAPGKKLFEHIKNYAKSLPNTPAREVNLENVFNEPIKHKLNVQNDNANIEESKTVKLDKNDSKIENNYSDSENGNFDSRKGEDLSVNEMLKNSQTLLKNVDRVLNDMPKIDECFDVNDADIEYIDNTDNDDVSAVEDIEKPVLNTMHPCPRDVVPPSAVCRWAAEILTALESLHYSGVICRDLNPDNILLGDRGQVILTYMISYPGLDMCLSKLVSRVKPGEVDMYIAPELYHNIILDADRDPSLDKVCDFWSFGAILYELLCGFPLSYYHRSIFTTHTILHIPEGLSVEVESILTQLLTYDPAERLGGGKDGIEEIKRHPYFKHIDWQEVYNSWTVPG